MGPCVVDLGSSNGTKVNGEKIQPLTAVPLLAENGAPAEVMFAHSTRAYAFELRTDGGVRRREELHARLSRESRAAAAKDEGKAEGGGGGREAGENGQGLAHGEATEFTAYVANLPYTITEASLVSFLCSSLSMEKETISRVRIPPSKDHEGQARGFAFVSFTTSESSESHDYFVFAGRLSPPSLSFLSLCLSVFLSTSLSS